MANAELRANVLCIPMTKEEKQIVETAAKREGMTMTAYVRTIFGAVGKIPLARLLVITEKEKSKK